MMKILLLVADLGGNNMMRTLPFERALKSGFEVKVVGSSSTGKIHPSIKDEGINYQIVPKSGMYHYIKTVVGISNSFDLVYCFKYSLPFIPAILSKLLKGKKLILDIDDYESELTGKNATKLKILEKLMWVADAKTVGNRVLEERFSGVNIPTGVDTNLFDPRSYDPHKYKKIWGLEDKTVVTFTGSPLKHKGAEEMCRVVSNLNKKGRDIALVFVGYKDNNPYARWLKERYESRDILFLEPLPFSQMPYVLASTDVVLLPQHRTPAAESQTTAKIFEAMAMAKPIIASDLSNFREYLGDTGMFVNPGDADDLESKLAELLDDPKLGERFGRSARERVKKLFDYHIVEEKIIKVVSQFES